MRVVDPDYDSEEELRRDPFWYCPDCGAQNSKLDGECQFCEDGVPNCDAFTAIIDQPTLQTVLEQEESDKERLMQALKGGRLG